MIPPNPTWIVSQLGAREHYAVARALAGEGALAGLVTEAWVPPRSLLGRLARAWVALTSRVESRTASRSHWARQPARLANRYHSDLAKQRVLAWNTRSVFFESRARLRLRRDWDLILARNHWFQRHAVRALERHQAARAGGGSPVLFSYSYTALEPFRWAKAQGWRTVLGQIDPGPEEEKIVAALHQNNPGMEPAWRVAPANYWEAWREECLLADTIIVNSEWSREALLKQGCARDKLRVVPLAYEGAGPDVTRTYPERFSAERPLRVLFLGQVILRKGAAELLEAARLLAGAPVEFLVVGPTLVLIPKISHPAAPIHWLGAVSRAEVARWYRDSDVLLLPTHSDGFGLTQLEAQSWKLPVIASRQCGDVVKDGVNGMVLSSVNAQTIADLLRTLVAAPDALVRLSSGSEVEPRFRLQQIARSLLSS